MYVEFVVYYIHVYIYMYMYAVWYASHIVYYVLYYTVHAILYHWFLNHPSIPHHAYVILLIYARYSTPHSTCNLFVINNTIDDY